MTANFKALPSVERTSRYALFHEIARGGMGTVYLARTRSSRGYRRVVALKRLHAHLAGDDRFRRMFLDEVRLISQLSHPNTGPAIDFGEDAGGVWLTMPFVLGEPLDRVIEKLHAGPPEIKARLPELTARILTDACEGLHAAHELRGADDALLQVVHRDVSPRNVMVGFDGVTRVIDFGIATAVQRLHQTATGELKGTAAYASPEHIRGQDVDRRADVWSLGVLGWELCTGRRLFEGTDSADVLDRVLHAPIEGPCERNPNLPIGLDEALMRALARDRERRYATARDMGKELSLFISEHGQPVGAAEVAECMEALLPGVHAERRKLLADVRSREVPSSRSATRRPREKPTRLYYYTALGVLLGAAASAVLMRWLG